MRRVFVLSVLSLALVSAACGGKSTTASPTSPSPTVNTGGSPGSPTGATISGTVAASSGSGTPFGPTALAGLSVQVVGATVSSAVSPAGDFSLRNVPPGDVGLKVTGSGDEAVVTVGGVRSGDAIQVRLVVTGNVGRVDFDSRGGNSGKVELEGLIESKTLPDMLMVNGQAVKVVTATTDIRKGNTPMTYAQLTVGFRVHVRGTMSAPGVVPPVLTADLIIVQNMGSNHVSGTVGAILSGSCSSFPFKFTVGSTTVAATSSTEFHPACSAVVVGAMVDAEGVLQTDGSLLADKVNVETEEVNVKGTVAAITSGTCAGGTLAFSVTLISPPGTKQVTTNASTSFMPSCSAVVVGAQVDVEGILQPGGSVLATKVDVESADVDVKGTVLAITSGTCAANNLAFSVR